MKKTPLKRKTRLSSKKGINRCGKKTKEWNKARETLKKTSLALGITTCELRWTGCMHDNFLGYAHSKKRRNITSQEELLECILTCNSCHDKLETHKDMESIVKNTIKNRQ